jgi:hypothetical protein
MENTTYTIHSEFVFPHARGLHKTNLEHKIEVSETILQGNIITAETLGNNLTHQDIIIMTLNERIYLN